MQIEEREHRYRVWLKELKMFLHSGAIETSTVDVISHDKGFSLDGTNVIYQQWIGQVDRNNVSIFEGDILRMNIPYREYKDGPLHDRYVTAVVSFSSGAFWFTGGGQTDCLWFHHNPEDREIIGNIMQNPELLEGN